MNVFFTGAVLALGNSVIEVRVTNLMILIILILTFIISIGIINNISEI